ncbi:Hypothetical protein PHPALM_9085 [Phytophthora palmivora]|uniref:Uncharacterized protein n=1 Tax=Phytophthora palmivora TaxID=4796 RepID=A0A2P4Y874_9STRA|nr:Hypothetical protein PHPALM_9085 [Phytophthora palmivora]
MKNKRSFNVGGRVWMYRPPRGAKAFKFVHTSIDPMRIVDEVGEQLIAHVSYLVTYHYPTSLYTATVDGIAAQLDYEDQVDDRTNISPARTFAGATSVQGVVTIVRRDPKKLRVATVGEGATCQSDTILVEDTTCSSTISNLYETDELKTTMESNGGFQLLFTMLPSKPARLWKTLGWRKACNKSVVQMPCVDKQGGYGVDKNRCTRRVVLKLDKGI